MVGGGGQFRPSVSSQTDWHGVQLCCGVSGGGIGGYSRRWKGWEFKATARGPHSRHTKGCPQNAPHSLSPLSLSLSLSRFAPPNPIRTYSGCSPALTHKHADRHAHTGWKTQARKQVKQFTGLILWRVCTHSNRTERLGGKTEGRARVGSRGSSERKKETTHPIQTTSRVKQCGVPGPG